MQVLRRIKFAWVLISNFLAGLFPRCRRHLAKDEFSTVTSNGIALKRKHFVHLEKLGGDQVRALTFGVSEGTTTVQGTLAAEHAYATACP